VPNLERRARTIRTILFFCACVLATVVALHVRESLTHASVLVRLLVPILVAMAMAASLIASWHCLVVAAVRSTDETRPSIVAFGVAMSIVGLVCSAWSVASMVGGPWAQTVHRAEAIAAARDVERQIRLQATQEDGLVGRVEDLRSRLDQAGQDSLAGKLFGSRGYGPIVALLFGERDRAGEILADLNDALRQRDAALEGARVALEAAEDADPETFARQFAEARRHLADAASVSLARIAARTKGLQLPSHRDSVLLRGPIDAVVRDAERLDRTRVAIALATFEPLSDAMAILRYPDAAGFAIGVAISADLLPLLLLLILCQARAQDEDDDRGDPPGTAPSGMPVLSGGPPQHRLASLAAAVPASDPISTGG
jgi:hypothetical protein